MDGNAIVVTAESGETVSRENYRLASDNRFIYSIDMSADRGQTWDLGSIEMTMTRVE